MKLGDYIKAYRGQHDLTMREFAAVSGLSAGYLSMLENDKNPKTGAAITPSLKTYKAVADATGISVNDLFALVDDAVLLDPCPTPAPREYIRVPVLGRVAAGIPIEAIEDIVGWEDLPSAYGAGGAEYFGLQIKGDSMEPKISDGDVVIVRKQPDVDSGEVAVVLINGCDATVKRIKKNSGGITLIANNPAFEPIYYSNEEVAQLPVVILGRVVELRAKI